MTDWSGFGKKLKRGTDAGICLARMKKASQKVGRDNRFPCRDSSYAAFVIHV
jgi:hypothetical protein